jgi:sulfate adenylyltransferase
MAEAIPPHGGVLVNRIADEDRQTRIQAGLEQMERIQLSEWEQCDLEMIAIGAFSPLQGFMSEAEFNSVCDEMKLPNGGAPWGVPVTCSVTPAQANRLEVGQEVALTDDTDRVLGVLRIESKFNHDKAKEAEKVYLTSDEKHPGVATVRSQGDICISGPIDVLKPKFDPEFPDYRLKPAETRAEFERREWNSIVAFQTRNPIHRAHEHLTKCALEICDGLLIHPLVGATKAGDIPADVRMQCYEVLIEKYYPAERVVLSVMPSAMRYAGPREAILHAIVRKNYGCTHFIVGRDHAGVGDYYGTYDAQKIFDRLDPHALGIIPLKFEHSSWCKPCEAMVSSKTCPHGPEDKIFLSGTKVREMLEQGERPPMEFSRPEVADILIGAS